jgi:uncharacterized iron-regulated protein
MLNLIDRSPRWAPTLGLLAVLGLGPVACSDTTRDSGGDLPDASVQLLAAAHDVILATYADLDAKALLLQAAVATLVTMPTEPNLAAARQAWRDARRPWEQSEAFLFGPVETQGIDPGIDSWPVNQIDLDNVLTGSEQLDKSFIDAQEGTLKGFHTMEYLLFGVGGAQTAAALTTRQREYLTGLTASFRGSTQALAAAWDPTGGAYANELTHAGAGSMLYPSQSAALQELVNGMIAICDEVANGKIADPFTQQDRSLEESQFSDNSNQDFADNIRSVQNVYFGTRTGVAGPGLTTLVLQLDATLDTQLKAQLTAAIVAIGNMTPTFGAAISTNPAAVEAAQDAIRQLKATLESDLMPVITGS